MAEGARHFLRLEIVAPDGPVFEGDVAMVVVPATRGELGILPRHAPLVAQLAVGEIRVQTLDDTWITLAVAEGFVKVQHDKVIVLADAAELSGDIDLERARVAMDRASVRLEWLRAGTIPEDEEVDPFRETMALRRAKNRIRVKERV